jgi:hypothetical protein
MESGWSVKVTDDNAMNNKVNSSIWDASAMSVRLLIQLDRCSSVLTNLCLNHATLYRLSGRSFRAALSNHLASQKGVFLPSPT